MSSQIRIGLIGDFNEGQKAHRAIPKVLAAASEGQAEAVWIPTDTAGKADLLGEFDGLWCAPGMPYRSADGVLRAIRQARMTRTPFLGTSAGFQYAVIEFARSVLGLSDADHQKSNPHCGVPVISPLGCALAGVRARVRFHPGTALRSAYGAAESTEEYHCSFGLNNRYRRLLEGGDLCVAAVDDQDEVRAVELDGHPFFVATLFQPEMRDGANPLAARFVAACAKRRNTATKMAG
jgi:CTP synthase (UTP-ammonia lyase)